MKKIISILIAGLLMLQGVALADYQLGTQSDILVVSGAAEPYSTVSFMLLNSDYLECEDAQTTVLAYHSALDSGVALTTDTIFYHNTVAASSDGIWEFTVPMTDIDKVDLTLISNAGEPEYIQYASVSFRTNMIPVLKEKAEIEDEFKSLAESMTYYIDFITDSPAMYKSLEDKAYIAEFCTPVIKELTEDSESLTTLKEVMNKAIYLAAVSEGKITEFDEVMYFDYDTDAVASATKEGKDKMVSLLKGHKFLTEAEYIKEAKIHIALQSFNYSTNRSGDYLLDALKDRNDILGLDLSDLEDLSKSKQAKAAKELADKKSKNLEDAQDNLDDIVDDLANESSSRGGGGPSSGSIPYSASSSTSVSEQYIQEQKYIYSDMSLSPWAADAVVYLASKEIVSGYTDGSFKPTAPITRAEFTKIVVEAFYGISSYEYENQFTDVEDGSWYAPYVNKAYDEGIISGTGNGTFCPQDTITRQDMAVILYNAALKHNLIKTVSDYAAFADDMSISDYARAAVYTLRDYGIISGVGEGTFSPLSNADRASACQMLYSLMIKSVN